MEQEQKQKKKKSLARKIGEKFGRGPDADELMQETLSDLTDIVGSMKHVFEDFEEGYEKQLDEERSTWRKLQSKLPSFLQAEKMKTEDSRIKRIKSNRSNLSELEDNLKKLEIIISSGKSSMEMLGQAAINVAIPGETSEKAMNELESRINSMENNVSESMNNLNAQISLIKSALDNMAGQLDEQGVVLVNIDEKIDVLDSKLDKAQEMLIKISRKLTGNRVIMLVVAGSATAVILNKLVLA
ncbi:MAG: hypothetical protein HeimC2_29900 [Candidatus Heimdallarchaeota archaeon LC_2]|nr:MAG: hypothetical protein HeimC2_29900 [Candidatus Heimdallarchaeota archaeon LC_2]